nr:hypothetical protein [Tanacetum cinerariifolium]
MEAPPLPDYIPRPEAPPSLDYIPGPEVPPSPDYIPRLEYPEYLPPADDVLPAEEQPLPAAGSPTTESPGYIADSEPEIDPEEEGGDDEESEEDSIDYSTSRGDDDADDDGDDLSKDDADDEDEEEYSDSEEEEAEHLALTVPTPAPHSSIPASEDSDETEPFEEGETAATPPPFGYRVTARISKRARFTTPTGGYEVGESSVAAARHIRPTLTVADSRRAEDRLIGRLRRERRYFHTLSTTYAKEVAYSRDYCTQIMDYCQSREVHTSTLVTQIEALQSDVSTLQRQQIDNEDRLTRHIQHEHAQRDKMAPKQTRTTRANPDPTTTATELMTQEAINNLIAQCVTKALAEYKTQRNSVVNRDTSHTTGTGPRTVRLTRECTYKDYLNCGPLKFNGTKGVIGLTRWFERTESVSSISNYTAKNQVKFASCTLIGSALTWWNSYMRADIYAAGSEIRPPMLNKENYVPWSSRLLRYAKSRPNGKLIHNSILNGPYTILLGLPEDIYAAVDSCETAQEIWLRVQQMMKGSDIGIQEKKAKDDCQQSKIFEQFAARMESTCYHRHQTKDLHTADYTQLYDFLKYNQKEVGELKAERLAKIQDPLALMVNSNIPYTSPAPHQDLSPFNQNYMQQLMPNPEDITDPITAMNMALSLMAKAFKLNYLTPTNNNQRISPNPRNRQIAQLGMNMGQDRQMQMVGGNGGNQFRQYAGVDVD